MESIEKEYKKLMTAGEAEKARTLLRTQFEELLRKIKIEGLLGKEGYVFIVRGKSRIDNVFRNLGEFDTVDEAREFCSSAGDFISEEDGEIRLEYGPAELKSEAE